MSEKKPEGSNQEFYRKTTKYWVSPGRLDEVKHRILQHLPEYRFDLLQKKKEKEKQRKKRRDNLMRVEENEQEDESLPPRIHSIYFDTERLDFFRTRLLTADNSMLYRYRTYGDNAKGKGFMEQKIRRPGWRGLNSIKQRFKLSADLVPEYLRFMPIEKLVESIDPSTKLRATEMQLDFRRFNPMDPANPDFSRRHSPVKLYPTVRSTYRRYVYQVDETAEVRISLDQELSLALLRPSSKMQPHELDTTLVEAFRRGFDYSSLEGIPDPREVFEFPFAVLELKLAFSNTDVMSKERLFIPPWFQALIDEGLLLTMDKFSKYTTGVATLLLNEIEYVPAWLQTMTALVDNRKSLVRQESLSSRSSDSGFDVSKPLKSQSCRPSKLYDDIAAERREAINNPARGKSVVVPMRVEPRSYFSNERTYLKWLRISMLLSLMGVGVIEWATEVVSGVILIVLGTVLMLRSIYVFRQRAVYFKRHEAGNFADTSGPIFLTGALVIGLVLFVLYTSGAVGDGRIPGRPDV